MTGETQREADGVIWFWGGAGLIGSRGCGRWVGVLFECRVQKKAFKAPALRRERQNAEDKKDSASAFSKRNRRHGCLFSLDLPTYLFHVDWLVGVDMMQHWLRVRDHFHLPILSLLLLGTK